LNFFQTVFMDMWGVLCEMSPYLLIGFATAGILSVSVSSGMVEKHLGGKGFKNSLKAALLGVPLPLCSCGVIPVAASLRGNGAGKGATVSFLTSTPQTGADSVLATYGLLGPVFAFVRVAAAFVSGVVAGVIVEKVSPDSEITEEAGESGTDGECHTGHSQGAQNIFYRIFHYGFVQLPRDIADALILGIFISALISALVPADYFAGNIGRGFISMLIMLAVGIPIYVCSTGSIPVAVAFIKAGISPGAALVFLIAGPATNAATLSTTWKLLGGKAAMVYLGVIAVVSLAAGAVINRMGIFSVVSDYVRQYEAGESWYGCIAAFIMTIILINAVFMNLMDKYLKRGEKCPHCS
jgi:hypothetical protein